mgnify:CR=1 FL=1
MFFALKAGSLGRVGAWDVRVPVFLIRYAPLSALSCLNAFCRFEFVRTLKSYLRAGMLVALLCEYALHHYLRISPAGRYGRLLLWVVSTRPVFTGSAAVAVKSVAVYAS